MPPDAELTEAVEALLKTRSDLALLTDMRETLEAAIQTRMGPATSVRGPGWRVTWRRTKDPKEVDYKGLIQAAFAYLDPVTIEVLSAEHTTTRPGVRRFVLKQEKERDDSTEGS